MLEKICKYLSFGSIAVLVAYMAAMTVLEKFSGTAAAMEWGYHSAVFIALWAVAAVAGTAFYLVEGKTGKNSIANPVSGIHLAFVFILSGALVTHIFGVQGALHLRLEDGEVREFIGDDMESRELPFAVSLADFEIRYYPGTYAPVDYTSTLEITDGDAGPVELSVSMNSPAVYRGYRFYQSSYDEDTRGSTLAVSHDPAGIAVTYTGYALLLLSLAGYFFRKDSGFRRLLARIAGRAAVWLSVPMLLCGAAPDMSAKEASGVPGHLPEETAAEYGRMYIYYNDRICPVQTLARDFTLKLYGKSSYMGLSPEQVLTGWIFYYDSWKNTVPEESEAASPKARKKIGDRRQAVMLVCSASILKLFPYRDGAGEVTWYSPVDRLPAEMDADQWLFIRKVMSLAGESVAGKDFDSAGAIFGKISEYQKKTASGELPPESRIAAERLYNTVERPKTAAMACLAAGLVLFILYCLFSNLGKCFRPCADVQRFRGNDASGLAHADARNTDTEEIPHYPAVRFPSGRLCPSGGFDWGVRSGHSLADTCIVIAAAFGPCDGYDDFIYPARSGDAEQRDGPAEIRAEQKRTVGIGGLFPSVPLSRRVLPGCGHFSRCGMGQCLVGQILGMGSQGSLGSDYTAGLLVCPSRKSPENIQRPALPACFLHFGIPVRDSHIFRRELFSGRPSQLCINS